MKLSSNILALIGLNLITTATASKGKAEVKACVYLGISPPYPITINWSSGSSEDRCIKNPGTSTSMTVSEGGVTCTSLGVVEIDNTGTCRVKDKLWGLSFTSFNPAQPVDGNNVGSATTKWTAGVVHSHVELVERDPGVAVCEKSLQMCDSTEVKWDHAKAESFQIIFPY